MSRLFQDVPICLFVVATRVQPSLRDDIEHVRVRVRVRVCERANCEGEGGEEEKKKRGTQGVAEVGEKGTTG